MSLANTSRAPLRSHHGHCTELSAVLLSRIDSRVPHDLNVTFAFAVFESVFKVAVIAVSP